MRSKSVPIPTMSYHGLRELLDTKGINFKEVHITHYSQFNLEEEEPDIIFAHNIMTSIIPLPKLVKNTSLRI